MRAPGMFGVGRASGLQGDLAAAETRGGRRERRRVVKKGGIAVVVFNLSGVSMGQEGLNDVKSDSTYTL